MVMLRRLQRNSVTVHKSCVCCTRKLYKIGYKINAFKFDFPGVICFDHILSLY